MASVETLPRVDSHTVAADSPPEAIWDAAHARLVAPARGPAKWYARVVGVRSEGLFDVESAERPTSLRLYGRHRFSTYRLAIEVREVEPGRSELTATTYAAFPGRPGQLYRAAVISTGAHDVITRLMLRRIAKRAAR